MPMLKLAASIALAALSGLSQADVVPLPPAADLSTLPAWAQIQKPPTKRALVIGIGDYEHAAKLATPPFDGDMVEKTLKKLDPNFVITHPVGIETTRAGLLGEVKSFARTIQPGDLVFVFFSGHGLERYDINYVVPVDANLAKSGHEGFTYISLDWILEQTENAQAGITVVILDACRTDPFASANTNEDVLDSPTSAASATPNSADSNASATLVASSPASTSAVATSPSASAVSGLSEMAPPEGIMIAFAAAPGKPSYSLFRGDTPDKGSIFTRRLVALVSTVNKPLGTVFGAVGGDVYVLTDKKQKPFVNAFDGGEVLLMDNLNLETDERETWIRTVSDSAPDEQLSGLRLFVNLYPAGPYSAAARARIKELETAPLAATVVAQVTPSAPVVLSGALKTPPVMQAGVTTAVADHDVFLRAEPKPSLPKILGTIKKGEEVQVLASNVRPGWSKILLQDGTFGYVGSVTGHDPTVASGPLSVQVTGDQVPNVIQGPLGTQWSTAFRRASAIVHIDVGLSADTNIFRARQQAFLRALRIRAALIAQGAAIGRISMTLGGERVAVNTATVSVNGGATP